VCATQASRPARPASALPALPLTAAGASAAADDAEFLLDDWNSGDEGDDASAAAAARKRRVADDSEASSSSGSDGGGAGGSARRRGARRRGFGGEEQDEYEPLQARPVRAVRCLLRPAHSWCKTRSLTTHVPAARFLLSFSFCCSQIIFCSRTHSQLAQVVGELLRTPFAEAVRTVVLAGRAQLCVNDAVRALASAPRINERCAELQRAGRSRASGAPKAPKQRAGGSASGAKATASSASASAGCPFLRKRRDAVAALRELVLAEPLEVEELAREGRTQAACPYYAARAAVPAAHLILLPYASLLQPDMRCGTRVHVHACEVERGGAMSVPD
jgi:hypothetical protein